MLSLAEKRTKMFRNVTRTFACLLLVSRTSPENVFLVIQILTCKWIRMRVFYHFIVTKALPQKYVMSPLHGYKCFDVRWMRQKATIRIYNVYQPVLVKRAHITIFGGLRCHKIHWKVIFLVLIRWFNDILFMPYLKIGEHIGIIFIKNCM